MQKTILFVAILLVQFIFGQQEKYDVVFKNVNLVSLDKNTVTELQSVAIKNGKILVIENTKKSKLKGVTEYDLKGQYIMPSLADAHVHLPEAEADLQRFFEMNLIYGVTKLRSMRGDWKHIEWREKYNGATIFYPKLYLSAPPISRNYDLTTEQIETFVKATKDNKMDFVKILSIKNHETFIEFDRFCKKYDVPLGGHFPRLASGISLNEDVFFNSNYKSIEHLGGLAGEKTNLVSRIKAIKENNIYVCPTLSWYSIGSGQNTFEELPKLAGMQFVSQNTMNEWLASTKTYREKIGTQAYKDEVASEIKDLDEKYAIIERLQKEGIKMLLSPDASGKYMMTGANMITEMELLKNANLSNAEILEMATSNFSDFFKGNYGVVQVGKDADFIVLQSNPLKDLKTLTNIKGIYFNEQFLDGNKLEAMKENLLKTAGK
ncbi:amidohydrolase family protein [Flavobacterium ardleyense]|uniref:Amidohydrolase family protein n=1 Tax=Flavobacterium ardleyense TaxID=2038737 RepID=A0ABW5Z9S6_9FLAO